MSDEPKTEEYRETTRNNKREREKSNEGTVTCASCFLCSIVAETSSVAKPAARRAALLNLLRQQLMLIYY